MMESKYSYHVVWGVTQQGVRCENIRAELNAHGLVPVVIVWEEPTDLAAHTTMGRWWHLIMILTWFCIRYPMLLSFILAYTLFWKTVYCKRPRISGWSTCCIRMRTWVQIPTTHTKAGCSSVGLILVFLWWYGRWRQEYLTHVCFIYTYRHTSLSHTYTHRDQ